MIVPKIWIDAGHGGKDGGACANGLIEKNLNLTVSLELKRLLEKNGFIVGMTRIDDRFYDLNERCQMANRWGADFFISVHHNAGGGIGYEVIHSIHPGNSQKMAQIVVEEYRNIGQVPHGNGIYGRKNSKGTADYYAVIRNTNMSSIISEFGYIDNIVDVQKFNTEDKLKRQARALAKAICRFYNVQFKDDAIQREENKVEPYRQRLQMDYPSWAYNIDTLVPVKKFNRGDNITAIGIKQGWYVLDIHGKEAWIPSTPCKKIN
jgi:N-acetylmuramoyl-L-alanine amidase